MKKALYSFAMAIVMVAGSMMSSCTSSAKNEENKEEKVEEVAQECPKCILDTPMFAGIELTDEQKDQLKALVPPCAQKCEKEEKCCDKAECEKDNCAKEECNKPCEGEVCPDFEAAKAKFFEEVKAILTPEQFAQFEANVANCQKCNKEGNCCEKAECDKAEK